MQTLEFILDEWEVDSVVDDNHLDTSSIITPKLHSKYLRMLVESKLRLTKNQIEYDQLRRVKFRYYRGELSREELRELKWDPWQFNIPLKSEMDEHLKGDTDLNQLKSRISYIETMISTLESILQMIKGRDWSIKNSITFKQFLAGN